MKKYERATILKKWEKTWQTNSYIIAEEQNKAPYGGKWTCAALQFSFYIYNMLISEFFGIFC